MKTILVLLLAAAISGCSVLGYRNVSDLKSEATRSADFVVNRSSVLIYRDFLRNANARHNDPVAGPFAGERHELDRSSGNGFVTMLHDGRVIGHVEIEHREADSARVRAWWLLASRYSDCSVRQIADQNLACAIPKK